MKGGFINVDDIGGRLSHQSPGDPLRELLLGMQEFTFPFSLRPIDNLRLAIGRSMLNVDLPNQPCGELRQPQLLLPVGCPLLEGHMSLQ